MLKTESVWLKVICQWIWQGFKSEREIMSLLQIQHPTMFGLCQGDLWGFLPGLLHSELFPLKFPHKFPLKFSIPSQPGWQAGTINVTLVCAISCICLIHKCPESHFLMFRLVWLKWLITLRKSHLRKPYLEVLYEVGPPEFISHQSSGVLRWTSWHLPSKWCWSSQLRSIVT